jgi:carbon-monoxide dehydrogenase catalytic subunit
MREIRKKSIDPAVEYFLPKAFEQGIDLVWDRFEASQPADGFGQLGLYCHDCLQGPCRINPFEDGSERGICGQSRDSFVANRYLKASGMGALSRMNSTLDLLERIDSLVTNMKKDKKQIDPKKIKALLKKLGIKEKDSRKSLRSIIQAAYSDFHGAEKWLSFSLSKKTLSRLREKGFLPSLSVSQVAESLSRFQNLYTDDCLPVLEKSMAVSLTGYKAMCIASDILDLLFGRDSARTGESNLGTLSGDTVNIVLQGDVPVDSAERIISLSRRGVKGAPGVRCYLAGESDLQGMIDIPLLTNSGSSEIAVLTGAVDAIVLGKNCLNPSLIDLCARFHTRTYSAAGQGFDTETFAKKVIEASIRNYKERQRSMTDIPELKAETIDGFNEGIFEKSVAFMAKGIADKKINGVVVFGGSSDVRGTQDQKTVEAAIELLKENVLVLAQGEAAISFAKTGLLGPRSTYEYCGKELKQFLLDLGRKTGIGKGLPPVLSFGSSLGLARILNLVSRIASRNKAELREFPVAAAYMETGQERDIADVNVLVAHGVPVFVGSSLPIGGSEKVEKILTGDTFGLFGASVIYDPQEEDRKKIAGRILDILAQRRE